MGTPRAYLEVLDTMAGPSRLPGLSAPSLDSELSP